MCEVMQKIKNDGIAEGISQGKQLIIVQMYHEGDISPQHAGALASPPKISSLLRSNPQKPMRINYN